VPDSFTTPVTSDPNQENAVMSDSPPPAAEEVVRQELLSSATSPLESDPETRKAAGISNLASPKPEEQQTIASSSPPGENDTNREKAAAIVSSVSSQPNRVDRQEVTSIPTTPGAIDQGREKRAETSNSPPLAVDEVVGQELPTPLTASDPDREKTAAISSSTPPALGHQAVTASSTPAGANDPDVKKSPSGPSSPSLAQNQDGREATMVPPSFSRKTQKQIDPDLPATEPGLPTFAQRQLDTEEVTVLLKRGKALIVHGDFAGARVTLKRAAEANNAEAALALASTYDPFVLRELKVYGFSGDTAMARAWYEKAKELGSVVAPRRLEMLARETR
jgi:hypothetical protein